MSSVTISKSQDLSGKIAVITGSSRGIGRAIALNLAKRGCTILGTCSDSQSLHHFKTLCQEITDARSQEKIDGKIPVHGIVADIYANDCHTIIADAVENHCASRVDIYVNNAADAKDGDLGALSVEEIQKSLLANIQNPVLIVEELVKRKMFQPESRIVYISSIRSRQPWSRQLMYSAGKSAGESLCRTWSQAFGGREEQFAFMAGTTANSVTVGLTQTDSLMMCPPEPLEEFKKEFMPLQSIPKFGQPDDVADVVGLLCSHEARWITGSVVSASGGGIKMQ